MYFYANELQYLLIYQLTISKLFFVVFRNAVQTE